MILNNFKVLVAKKEVEENRRLPYRVISEETKLSTSILTSWANQRVRRYDADTLASLCQYFGVGVGELLYLSENGEGSNE